MDRETGIDQEEHAPKEHDNSEEYDNSKECQENTLLNQINHNNKQIQQLSQIIQQIDFRSLPGRVAELGSLSSGAKMAMKIFVKRVLTIFASNASFLRVIANLQN